MPLPLPQRCTLYRVQAQESDDNFYTGVESWTAVASKVPCRVDFLVQFGSREEVRSEDFVPRNHGFIYFNADSPVKPHDVVVVEGDHYTGMQFDVRYVDPAVGSVGVNHLESVVARRDNLISL